MRKPSTPSTDPVALGNTITEIDGLCQETLSRIGAVARLASREGARLGRHELQPIVLALELIDDMCDALIDHVNSAAGRVGCNFKEDSHAGV